MTNWNEQDHPRDDEGKFTYKNGGSSSLPRTNEEMLKRVREEKANALRAADILYPTMRDKKEEFQKEIKNDIRTNLGGELVDNIGQKSSLKNEALSLKDAINECKYKMAIDNIGLKTVRDKAISDYGVETAENLYMSKSEYYMNTEYAKEHFVIDNYKKMGNKMGIYFKNKIIEQLELKKLAEPERQKILDSTKGIYIEPSSKSSMRLAEALIKEPEFTKILDKSIKSIKGGKEIKGSLKFVDKNFYYALGHADVQNFKINQNGDLSVLVTDVYDFNPNPKTPLLKAGRTRQEQGKIKPYFVIYDVIIKRENLKKYD